MEKTGTETPSVETRYTTTSDGVSRFSEYRFLGANIGRTVSSVKSEVRKGRPRGGRAFYRWAELISSGRFVYEAACLLNISKE